MSTSIARKTGWIAAAAVVVVAGAYFLRSPLGLKSFTPISSSVLAEPVGDLPNIPEKQRPWRMLWYQTGPYYAYYYAGRYQDVIALAGQTLDAMSEPILEESFYWRAQAELALGNQTAAVDDLHQSLVVHAGFGPSLALLSQIGVAP